MSGSAGLAEFSGTGGMQFILAYPELRLPDPLPVLGTGVSAASGTTEAGHHAAATASGTGAPDRAVNTPSSTRPSWKHTVRTCAPVGSIARTLQLLSSGFSPAKR